MLNVYEFCKLLGELNKRAPVSDGLVEVSEKEYNNIASHYLLMLDRFTPYKEPSLVDGLLSALVFVPTSLYLMFFNERIHPVGAMILNIIALISGLLWAIMQGFLFYVLFRHKYLEKKAKDLTMSVQQHADSDKQILQFYQDENENRYFVATFFINQFLENSEWQKTGKRPFKFLKKK